MCLPKDWLVLNQDNMCGGMCLPKDWLVLSQDNMSEWRDVCPQRLVDSESG
jgi:hypothetical protein